MNTFSVIVPTYNHKDTLQRALTSILSQAADTDEVIVIDDASTDNTETLFADGYPDTRVRYYRLEKNSGVHEARNKGMELARGEYLLFLDSDDEFLPGAFDKVRSVLRDGSVDFVLGSFRTSDGEPSGFDRPDGPFPFKELLCEEGIQKHKVMLMCVKKSSVAGIRWEEKNLDFIFTFRVARHAKTYYLSAPLGIYHTDTGGGSMTQMRKVPDVSLSIRRARTLDRFLHDFGASIIERCRYRYGYYAYGAAVGLLLAGETKKARAYAFQALRFQPRPRYLFFYLFVLIPASSRLLRLVFPLKAR